MGAATDLYKKAKQLIPGGTQLLSKRPELFLPNQWPAYYQKAKGCQVWDLDNHSYLDMSFMGIGACVLGYADPDINQAAKTAVDLGAMTTLNCPEEVELAELLFELHPWANMARYARSGGEAMAIAVRIARAKTKRDKILFCGYHGWHDWYLAANLADDQALDGHLLSGLAPAGVPRGLMGTALPFKYNDTKLFLNLIEQYQDEIAAVVMEPIRNIAPVEDFLEIIRQVTQEKNIVLIFDEITAGWRLNIGGAHLKLGINPDIAVFGKAISNGFPMAAIIGVSEVMTAAQESFISSTYWTEKIGPVTAIATIEKMKKEQVPKHLITVGQKVKECWRTVADKNDMRIKISGIDPLSHFVFEYDNSLAIKTLFTQLMLERNILATTSLYASYAHQHNYLEVYFNAIHEVFPIIKEAIANDSVEKILKGPICHGGFKRLT
jgi:glutamate-1-semialdehyde 2,1-aminomutase